MTDLASFVRDALELAGAAVEVEGDRVEALLVPEASRALSMDEHVVLATGDPVPGAVPCGWGTETLVQLAALAIGGGRVASLCVDLPAVSPRPPRIVPVNVSFGDPVLEHGQGLSLVCSARWTARSDDLRQGVVTVAVTVPEGLIATPPDMASIANAGTATLPPLPEEARGAERTLTGALDHAALEAVAPFREAVARRHRRDAERVDRYFADVAADMERRLASRPSKTLQAKLASLPEEHHRRRAQLAANHGIRVTVTPITLTAVWAPCVTARIPVRRRSHGRTLALRYDVVTRSWASLACEGCGAPTSSVAMCDAAAHVLCPACWDACGSGGHRPCFCCAGRPMRTPWQSAPVGAPPDAPMATATPAPLDARPARVRSAAPAPAMARPAGATFVPAPAPPLPPPDDGATAARVIEALAAGGGWMTSGEIRDLVPMDAERMRRIVEPLVRDGRVERQGQRRGTRYRLVRPS